jgi:hypothetical protein
MQSSVVRVEVVLEAGCEEAELECVPFDRPRLDASAAMPVDLGLAAVEVGVAEALAPVSASALLA